VLEEVAMEREEGMRDTMTLYIISRGAVGLGVAEAPMNTSKTRAGDRDACS
jgi:hypothetical protein